MDGLSGQPDILELKYFCVGQGFFDNQIIFLSLAESNMPVYHVLVDVFMLIQRDVVQTFS